MEEMRNGSTFVVCPSAQYRSKQHHAIKQPATTAWFARLFFSNLITLAALCVSYSRGERAETMLLGEAEQRRLH
jgi:hypothetical protein